MNYWLIFLLLFSISCSQKDEETTEDLSSYIHDARLLGGSLDTEGTIKSPINVRFDTSVYNEVKITWEIPSLYETEDWQVVILKLKDGRAGSDQETMDPTQVGDIDNEIVRTRALYFVDTNVSQNQKYFYFVFLNIRGRRTPDGDLISKDTTGLWSKSIRYTIITPTEPTIITEPSPETFWDKLTWKNYFYAIGDTSYQTFKPAVSTPNTPQGAMTSAFGGSVRFFVDRENNRVLVYENSTLRSCEQFIDDPVQYYGCRLGSNQKASPQNILGQPDQFSTLTCQEHDQECLNITNGSECLAAKNGFCQWTINNECRVRGSKCLTHPSGIAVKNNSLLIADSGNNRVVFHPEILYTVDGETKPIQEKLLIGCDPSILMINQSPTRCAATKVIGKKDLDDFTVYDVSTDGMSSLNNPTGLLIKNEDVYIADTDNHRVVSVKNFFDNEYFLCDIDNNGHATWGSSLCSFKKVIGQPNLFSNITFESIYNADPEILTGTFKNQLNDNPNMLKHFFKYPTIVSDLTYVKIELREALRENELYDENMRQLIIMNQGDLSPLDIPEEIKNEFNTVDKVLGYKLMIGVNEDFHATTDIGSNISLRSRILVFDNDPLDENSECNESTFYQEKCDAEFILGQADSKSIPVLSGMGGGSGMYTNLGFTIDGIGGLTFVGETLYVTDYITNNIYLYKNFPEPPTRDWSRTGSVLNPEGEYISSNLVLPDLKNVTDIYWDEVSSNLMIIDTMVPDAYKLNFVDYASY